MVCVDIGSIVSLRLFSLNIAFHAHAIIFIKRNFGEIDIKTMSNIPFDAKFDAESEFLTQKIIPPTHSTEESISEIFVGLSSKITSTFDLTNRFFYPI